MEKRNFLEKVNICFEDSFSIAAEVASFLGNNNDCISASKRALSYNPNNSKALNLAPTIEPSITLIRSLIESAGIALQNGKDNFQIWRSLCSYYLALGDFPNSFAAIAHISSQINPKDNDFLYVAGVVYSHFHYPEIAIGFFQQIMQNDPLYYLSNDIAFRLGILYRNIDAFKQSDEAFKSIIRTPYKLNKDDMQMQIAYNNTILGIHEPAMSIYNHLHFMYPNNVKITQQYYISKVISYPLSSLREVQQELALDIQKTGFDPILALVDARISMKIDDTSIAYEKCKKCLSYCSDSPYFWISLGVIYFKNGQYDDAEIAFKHSLFIRYDIPEAWLDIGFIYELKGDQVMAVKMYRTGFERCPTCQAFANRLQNPRHECSMLEIPDIKFFVQIPEKFSKDYMAAVPILPKELFPEEITEDHLKMLSTLPDSLI